jgi:porin
MDNEAMISTAQHSAAQLHSIKFSVKVCCLVLLLSGIYTSEICASEPKDAVPDVSQQSSSQTVSAETQQATPQTTSEPERLWKNSTWVLTPAQSLPDKPLISHDPLAWLYVNDSNSKAWYQRLQLDVISYTAVDDYTTDEISATPTEKPRHNQGYGRLDFNAHWNVYQSGSTAGSIHILVRSGESLGLPQSYNINTAIGSGISPMCLQNKTVSVNVLYWEQDFLNKKLQFHIGHIHPNQYVNLSYLGDDETFEFMASPYDGNASNPYVGSYSTGAAVLYQATPHIYVHAVATDTEESAYDGPRTLQDGNMAESYEVGWFSGEYGHNLRSYRLTGWHEDTKTNGAGYGGSLEFDHELASGWAPLEN